MSKYEELCRAYSDQHQAQLDYWQALQIRAVQIADGLWKYLEYPNKTFPDHDGKGVIPYVTMTKPGEDKECHFMDLPGSKGAVQFDVVVTLEEEPGLFPKSKVRFSFNIGSTGEVLRVWDKSGSIDVEAPIGSVGNEALYAQIFEALKSYLSQRPVLKKE